MLYDAMAGLYITRTRAYNPKTGRFLQRDILDEQGKDGVYAGFPFGQDAIGSNLYAWCNNNPVSRVDPSGLSSFVVEKNGRTYHVRPRHRGESADHYNQYLANHPMNRPRANDSIGRSWGNADGQVGAPKANVVVQHKTVVVAPKASPFEWMDSWRDWGSQPSGWVTPSIADYTLTGGVMGGVDVDGDGRLEVYDEEYNQVYDQASNMGGGIRWSPGSLDMFFGTKDECFWWDYHSAPLVGDEQWHCQIKDSFPYINLKDWWLQEDGLDIVPGHPESRNSISGQSH